jgi:hypothetical protein
MTSTLKLSDFLHFSHHIDPKRQAEHASGSNLPSTPSGSHSGPAAAHAQPSAPKEKKKTKSTGSRKGKERQTNPPHK